MLLQEIFTSPYAAAVWNWELKNPMLWIGYFEIKGKRYKVEVTGVHFSKELKQAFSNPSDKELEKIFANANTDIIYNASFGLMKEYPGKKPVMATSPTDTGDAIVVLTTVSHMIRECINHVQGRVVGYWPSHPKLINIYKRTIEKVFPGWNIVKAKYGIIDGFIFY